MKFDAYHMYLFCFFIGLFYAIIASIFSGAFGSGGHGDGGSHDFPDSDTSGHDVSGESSGVHLSPINSITIATFITTFGGTGVIVTKLLYFPAILSLPTAFLSGIGVSALVFLILAKMFAITESSSEAYLPHLIDTTAEVITTIPADGVGEVAYVSKGTRYNKFARSEEYTEIPKNSMVKITRIVGGTVYVKEILDEKLRKIKEEKNGNI